MNKRNKMLMISWYYRRLMLVRYFVPVLFFINLYWIFIEMTHQHLLVIVPIVQFLIYIVCFCEQYLFANSKVDKLKYHQYLLIIGLVLGSISFFSQNIMLYFPLTIHICVVCLAFLVKILLINRIYQINHNVDNFYLKYNSQLNNLKKGK